MIYLNNAATSFPKPRSVINAVSEALEQPPVSPFRSNSAGSVDVLGDLRRKLGRLFGIKDTDRIFFALNATDATNRVLGGLKCRSFDCSPSNHNSVLRPLANNFAVSDQGQYDLTLQNHCSNVTGEIIDVRQVCSEAHRRGQIVLLDTAQSAGCIPIDVDGWGVDILIFTGHKSLLGPMGTGGYYVRRGIDLRPTEFGGTGRDSTVVKYHSGDWEYEVGTQNLPGLAGLSAGVDYVLSRGVDNICNKERELTLRAIAELRKMDHVALYTAPEDERQGPVFSFNIKGLLPSDVGYILLNSYGINVRTGLHCAPLINRQLGTMPYGTVRVSLSDFTTREELQALVSAVGEIASSL